MGRLPLEPGWGVMVRGDRAPRVVVVVFTQSNLFVSVLL
jgi:hypothetical protein